jgi:hypothetical protein
MIEILEQSTDICLAVHFSGKVNVQEYQQFLDALNERFKPGGKISLVLELTGFDFYDELEVAKQDFKFGLGEYKHVYRAALVGDQKWIEWFARLIGPFTRAEEKHFPEGQLEAAISWACA